MRSPNHSNSGAADGFSLLELTVATAISFVVLAIIGMVLHAAQLVSVDVDRAARDSTGVVRLIDELGRKVADGGRIVAVTKDRLVLQVPVDGDGDGDVLATDGSVQWGAEGVEGQTYEYRWEYTRHLAESTAGVDVNADGDQLDEYRLGDVFLLVVAENGSERLRIPLTSTSPVLTSPDGASEPRVPPLFEASGVDGVRITTTLLAEERREGSVDYRTWQATKLITQR